MIIPYLSFKDNCEEAFNSYIRAFGGEILYYSRYTLETGGAQMNGKIMHLEAMLGDTRFAGADSADELDVGNCVKLMMHFGDRASAEACFDILAEGGTPLQRLTPHPPPDDGGMGALVKDKFGYTWILTAPNDHKN